MNKELSVQELSEFFLVDKNYIYQMRHKGLSYQQIVERLRRINTTEYKIKTLFNLYVKLYMNLIKINYSNPTRRKELKDQFFTSWKKEALPFTEHSISVGWSKITKNVYFAMDS
jgi:hypothetical protein